MADIVPEKRVFRNGNRWWLRLKTAEPGVYARRSTGTSDLTLANRMSRMVTILEESRPNRDLLAAMTAGDLPVATLYDAFAEGNLEALRVTREREKAIDPDIEPYVQLWKANDLEKRKLDAESRASYIRQVRALVPEGIPFPCSRLNEDKIRAVVSELPVSDSTRRRYLAAWMLFCRFVRRRVPGISDPFEYMDEWAPKNAEPRSTFWNHATKLEVLSHMEGDEKRAMALTLGSGMELVALLAMRGRDVLGERMVVAHGTKSEFRRDRTIYVDAWAWGILHGGPMARFAEGKLFPELTENRLRTAFYEAQVKAGLVAEPPRSRNGKKLWKSVGVHTIHDARHTYALTRLLGADNEPKRSMKFVSMQLGHANEQMVQLVYARVSAKNRLAVMQAEIEQDDQTEVLVNE